MFVRTGVIAKRLQGEFSGKELSWYKDCAQAISVFACLALGALLGKFQAGEIDDAGFMLGDARLPAFLSLHNEVICAHYAAPGSYSAREKEVTERLGKLRRVSRSEDRQS